MKFPKRIFIKDISASIINDELWLEILKIYANRFHQFDILFISDSLINRHIFLNGLLGIYILGKNPRVVAINNIYFIINGIVLRIPVALMRI